MGGRDPVARVGLADRRARRPESPTATNDTEPWGIGRTVADPLRNGIGVDEVVVVVGR
jgi:hypothetical protein